MPVHEFFNLFLGVVTAVSLFLFVQYMGHAFIRYLNRY